MVDLEKPVDEAKRRLQERFKSGRRVDTEMHYDRDQVNSKEYFEI